MLKFLMIFYCNPDIFAILEDEEVDEEVEEEVEETNTQKYKKKKNNPEKPNDKKVDNLEDIMKDFQTNNNNNVFKAYNQTFGSKQNKDIQQEANDSEGFFTVLSALIIIILVMFILDKYFLHKINKNQIELNKNQIKFINDFYQHCKKDLENLEVIQFIIIKQDSFVADDISSIFAGDYFEFIIITIQEQQEFNDIISAVPLQREKLVKNKFPAIREYSKIAYICHAQEEHGKNLLKSVLNNLSASNNFFENNDNDLPIVSAKNSLERTLTTSLVSKQNHQKQEEYQALLIQIINEVIRYSFRTK